jgi:hypothetical protein
VPGLVHRHGIAGCINGSGRIATMRAPETAPFVEVGQLGPIRGWIFRGYQRLEAGSEPRKSRVLACLERPLPLSGWTASHASGHGRELGWAQARS